jgi:hypothetical protein
MGLMGAEKGMNQFGLLLAKKAQQIELELWTRFIWVAQQLKSLHTSGLFLMGSI